MDTSQCIEVTFWYLLNSLVHLSSDSEYNCLNLGCAKVIFLLKKKLKLTSTDLTVSRINRPYSLNVLINAHSRSGRKWRIFLTSGQLYISAVRR